MKNDFELERLSASKFIDKLVVATSNDPSDNAIETLCIENNTEYFRGSLNNVLERFYRCAIKYNPKHVVRLTGDCPLTDVKVIDSVIKYYLDNDFDYVSNCIEPTFPDGLDIEIFSFKSIEKAFNKAKLPSEKEHVTPYINKNPTFFKIGIYRNDKDYSHLRWTVDEPEDFAFISKIYELLYPVNPYFNMKDVLDLIENNPELSGINDKFERNEGLKKTLKKDMEVIVGGADAAQ